MVGRLGFRVRVIVFISRDIFNTFVHNVVMQPDLTEVYARIDNSA